MITSIQKAFAFLTLITITLSLPTLFAAGQKGLNDGVNLPKDLMTLKGSVLDETGKPLQGATIRLVYGGTQNEILNQPIQNGQFEVSFESAGSYHLFIKKEGYRSAATPLLDEYMNGLELKVQMGIRQSVIQSNNRTFNEIMNMHERISAREQQMVARLMAHYNQDKESESSFKPIDYTQDIERMERELIHLLKRGAQNDELKIKLLEYFSFKGIQSKVRIKANLFKGEISSEIALKALDIIEPGSNLWYLYPESFYAILLSLPNEMNELTAYADQMMDESLSAYTVSQCILFLLRVSDQYQNEPIFDEYLGKLLSFYPTTAAAFKAKSDFELPTSLSIGETVPPFSLQNMDEPRVRLTEQLLLGKYYLMDFWSTSCGGCIQAMPDHTEMYEKYKDGNFTILSISLDQNENKVYSFRQNRYPMPWLNAFAEDGFNGKIAKDFEIGWLPRLYLVSPDGVIIAKDDELRGSSLEKTLQKLLD